MLTEFPDTRESLIAQIRDPENRDAWDHFVAIYGPVFYRMARAKGLQDADAQDLVQRVWIAISSAIGRWEKSDENIRFRHWLRRVARNAILNALTRRRQDQAAGGTTAQLGLLQQVDDQDSIDFFEWEYRHELYRQAAKIVKHDVQAETWTAFERTVVVGQSIAEAAAELGKSIGTIYASRSRVMRRLRETVAQLEQAEQ